MRSTYNARACIGRPRPVSEPSPRQAHQSAALLAVIVALVTASGGMAAAQARHSSLAGIVASSVPAAPADLVYANRRITTFRAAVLGRSPAERAAAVRHLLDTLVDAGRTGEVTRRLLDGAMVIAIGGHEVFAILPLDVNELAGETLEARAAAAAENLQLAIAEATELRTPRRIMQAAALALAATLCAATLLWLIARLHRVLSIRLEAAALRQLQRLSSDAQLGRLSRARDVLRHAVTAASLAGGLLVLYSWLTFVLRHFPYTRPWGESLRGLLLERVGNLLFAFAGILPNLFTAFLIFLAVRFGARLMGALCEAAEAGRISIPYVYPETAQTTHRLVTTLLWLLGLVAAYPYLPGSQSDAFKGISVLVGLVISIGSSGIVNQMMSGLTLTYSRAVRLGDYVRIGDVEGTVAHLGSLSTKLTTPRGEEVTMPNALVVSCVTTNFSRLADQGVYVPTRVTIGYDTPWRQVRALLLMAAERTPGVRARPAPAVLQTSLEDFYVGYTLLVCLEHPHQRAPVLDALHASIQDAFNEYGVQIMSPNYEADPERPKIVPADQWFADPAGAPGAVTGRAAPTA